MKPDQTAGFTSLVVIPEGNLRSARPHVPLWERPTAQRYLRFNLVGLLGAALQLTTLALLNHLLPHHYLLTSTAALELTLLHNLTWHLHYTWPDRPNQTSRLHQALRFHLTNGLTSLLGNLTLIPLLIHTVHLPVLAANALAIAACSLLNYALANHWVFRLTRNRDATGPRTCPHGPANPCTGP